MTGEIPAKKKRRRRNRRRGSGGNAGPVIQQEAQQEERINPAYDEALATREIAASKAEHAQRLQSADELAALLLPLIMQARHRVVFDWMSKRNNLTAAQAITQIVRAEVARQTPDWREAQGGGGGSSKDLAALTRRMG